MQRGKDSGKKRGGKSNKRGRNPIKMQAEHRREVQRSNILEFGSTSSPNIDPQLSASGEVLIDGSFGEGGGQVLRNTFALSALLQRPIHVDRVRAGRKNPGLRHQHLCGLLLVNDLYRGTLTGAKVGSSAVSFHPRTFAAERGREDKEREGEGEGEEGEGEERGAREKKKDNNNKKKKDKTEGEFVADIGTAGSTGLLVQIALPTVVFAPRTVAVEMRGGTNAIMAPQVDYTLAVLKPLLARMGVEFDIDVERRGFFPRGGGVIHLHAKHIEGPIKPIVLTERGRISRIYIRSFVSGSIPVHVAERMAKTAKQIVRKYLNGATSGQGEQRVQGLEHAQHERGNNNRGKGRSSERDEGEEEEGEVDNGVNYVVQTVQETAEKAEGDGTGIIIVAYTTSGCIMAGSALGERNKTAEAVGQEAADVLIRDLHSGGCVDEYMQDQLIIWMALAEGKSQVRCGPLSLHTTTAVHFTGLMTGAKFDILQSQPTKEGEDPIFMIECTGIGYKAGQTKVAPVSQSSQTDAPTMSTTTTPMFDTP